MKEVGRALYGSQNYLLSNEDSDKDYKVFLCPSFEDLYRAHKADKSDLPQDLDPEHYSVLDVRKFAELVKVGNVNCLEYLFSLDLSGNSDFLEWCAKARKFYENGYLGFTWPTFYASLTGMVKNSFDRYGVTRKSMSRAYFLYLFAATVVQDNFKVSASTWRANNWNETVRAMRFDKTSFLPDRENVFKSLERLNTEATNKMDAYTSFYTYGDTLADEMKKLVRGNVL